jgi:hypothetical protein
MNLRPLEYTGRNRFDRYQTVFNAAPLASAASNAVSGSFLSSDLTDKVKQLQAQGALPQGLSVTFYASGASADSSPTIDRMELVRQEAQRFFSHIRSGVTKDFELKRFNKQFSRTFLFTYSLGLR